MVNPSKLRVLVEHRISNLEPTCSADQCEQHAAERRGSKYAEAEKTGSKMAINHGYERFLPSSERFVPAINSSVLPCGQYNRGMSRLIG